MPLPFFGASAVRVSIPVELASVSGLLDYLDLSVGELKKIWWFRERMYHQFKLSKQTKKVRIICAPDKRLKFLQRRIVLLLNKLYRVRNPVHGFVAGKSVKTNALSHLRKHFVLNIDLEDFFPSITEKRVSGVLKSIGVDVRVANIVARLCCYNSYLPQGAPSSPVLSNMICFRLDKKLLTFAKGRRCIYTRYADDITFSSYRPLNALFGGPVPSAGHFLPNLLAPDLRNIFTTNGFKINTKKTHYADRHSRRMVTGLKVNEILNVDRRYIRNIRAALYSVEKLGKEKSQKKFEGQHGGTCNLETYLKGKISWVGWVRGQSDPVYRALAVRFNRNFPNVKIRISPTADEIRERAVWVIEYCEDRDGEAQCMQGSAFFLNGTGFVTAAHCVKGATEITTYHPSKLSNKFKVTLQKIDDHRDLAILNHNIPETEYFELERSANDVSVGDELIALGYPGYGSGDTVNVREGKVSSLPRKSAVKMIEVTQKLSQGMSGGPLLDKHNAVVGIIHKGGPDEGRDFAINIDELNSWLSD